MSTCESCKAVLVRQQVRTVFGSDCLGRPVTMGAVVCSSCGRVQHARQVLAYLDYQSCDDSQTGVEYCVNVKIARRTGEHRFDILGHVLDRAGVREPLLAGSALTYDIDLLDPRVARMSFRLLADDEDELRNAVGSVEAGLTSEGIVVLESSTRLLMPR